MRTIEIKIYKFEELSKEAKKVAIQQELVDYNKGKNVDSNAEEFEYTANGKKFIKSK